MALVQSGYLIEKSFERMYLEFGRPAASDEFVYSIPRRGVPPDTCPKRYRGIARQPLQPWFHEISGAPGVEEPEELEAAEEMRKLEESGRSAEDFVFEFADVERVRRKLKRPSDWELLWAADCGAGVVPPSNGELLGFEPTWFVGDHFSAISDSMCFPEWHGPDEAGVLFARHHDRLNDHALFRTRSDADEFLRYYRSFDWTETGDYVIAEVRAIS